MRIFKTSDKAIRYMSKYDSEAFREKMEYEAMCIREEEYWEQQRRERPWDFEDEEDDDKEYDY